MAGFAAKAAPPSALAEAAILRASLRSSRDAPTNELRSSFDTEWTRVALASDRLSTGTQDQLGFDIHHTNVDVRDPFWTATPEALPAVATAVSTLLTRGLSLFEIVHEGRTRQRHSLSAYWKRQGVKLAWRIEF